VLPCDLTDKEQVKTLLAQTNPDAVINLAAYTDVDGCENDPAKAMAFNAGIPENLAAAMTPDHYFIQISTDQVYGDKSPHKEADVSPLNIYGQSKYEGELRALAHGNTTVLRVNMFGHSKTPGRTSLSDFYIDSFTQKKKITIFQDVFFSPLSFPTLSGIIGQILDKKLHGIFNVGSQDGMSKLDFALLIARHKGLDTSNATVINSSDIPARARRPKDMRMDVSRLENALNISMPTLLDEVKTL